MGVSRNDWERIQVNVVSGADGSGGTAATMTLSGITTDDHLLAVVDLNGASSADVAFENNTTTPDSSVVISDDDTLKTDLNLDNKALLVVWADVSKG